MTKKAFNFVISCGIVFTCCVVVAVSNPNYIKQVGVSCGFLSPISVASNKLEIGSVPEGTVVEKTLYLRNETSHEVSYLRSIASCGCTTVRLPNSIPAHMAAPITVRFDSTGKRGDITKVFWVFVPGRKEPAASVSIVGRITNDIRVTPLQISVNDISHAGQVRGILNLKRVSGHALHVLTCCGKSLLSYKCTSVCPGEVDIEFAFVRSNLAGGHTVCLSISTDDPDMPTV